MSRPAQGLPEARVLDDLAEYATGLEREIAVLTDLLHLSAGEEIACRGDDYAAMTEAAAERAAVTSVLDDLEVHLAPLRARVAATLGHLEGDECVARVSARHREAAALVTRILEHDDATVALLAAHDARRRAVAQQLDTGEATLAAYRRTIAPGSASANLLNRRG